MCNLKTFMSRVGLRNYQNQGTLIFPSFIISLSLHSLARSLALSLSLTHTHTHTHCITSIFGFFPLLFDFSQITCPQEEKIRPQTALVYISTTLYPERGKGSFAFFFFNLKNVSKCQERLLINQFKSHVHLQPQLYSRETGQYDQPVPNNTLWEREKILV